ncbi:Nitroreductase [Oscillibacter sp. PC13]|uniref:nitroreductase family protein n=1 Tax=Oscillibacter sp. PC13 TaxID=1855299 RepID=UPI0008EE4293|nr:nitroreductase family protein [Oscillibacter sp. PC13]SFP44516.1 Nitroreductase [Oscillibacter sp. PC13]
MELLELMQKRRSIRQYVPGAAVPEETLQKVLQAGLLAASGKAIRPWELIVVRNHETLQAMSGCRVPAVKMLQGADCAIVVIADGEKTDVWTEDCSVVMANMHLMADALGLGSCWVQGRLRQASDGRTSEEFLRDILGYPETYHLEAILTLGVIEHHPHPHTLEHLLYEKIHHEKF